MDSTKAKEKLYDRLQSGKPVPMDDPHYHFLGEDVDVTMELQVQLNNSKTVEEAREWLSKIIGNSIDASTTVFTPFYRE